VQRHLTGQAGLTGSIGFFGFALSLTGLRLVEAAYASERRKGQKAIAFSEEKL